MKKKDILGLYNVSKRYIQSDQENMGRTAQPVLSGISVIFEQGQSYAITGVSGSGKSTLLHILGGLDVPTSGLVTFNDQSIALLPAHKKNELLNRHIGFVFQFHYLIRELCVLENIMMMGLIKGDSKQYCYQRAQSLLDMVGLQSKADVYPTQLSGGEQQRVSIARALFNKPSFLLADEPTGNLDADNAERVVDLFCAAQQEWGMGIVLCSHDPSVYKRMQILYKMHDGVLVESGSL